MPSVRTAPFLTCCLALAAIGRTDAAEKAYPLLAGAAPGEAVRVEAQLEVGGDVKLTDDGKPRSLRMSVSAQIDYDEKALDIRRDEKYPYRSARFYRRARAAIKIDEGGIEPALREERRLVVADESGGQVKLYSPSGPLTREELDLIDLPANSLLLDRLLPERPVKIGDHWRHDDGLIAELLCLDVVSQSDVESRLKEVSGDRARIELAGHVLGAVGGVATEIEVKAKYRYDFQQRRVTGLGLLVKEKRAIGPVNTGLDVVAKLQLALGPAEDARELSDTALAKLPLDPQPELLALACQAPTKKFHIYHDRDWHLMADAGELLALRFLDRGELVAQCNVSSLADVEPGKEPTLATFQHDLERSLGKSFERFVTVSEGTSSVGHHIYRVIAEGRVADLPIQWHYYLVADPEGHLAVFAFTVEAELVERLGEKDEALVATIEFVPRGKTGQPTSAAARPSRPRR
ncbi:MAG TPA: hypothetical protein VHC22_17205 [Pirellulales bacterium]|nr:hypothetical protein [Pirellulales bacterium]